jgi:CheY-like chemotaxis protein
MDTSSKPANPTPRSLLIVDDEESVRETLSYVLNDAGYRTLVAESGAAALSLAAIEQIDGALIDVQMPQMDGIQTCLRLQRQAIEQGRPALRLWLMAGAPDGAVQKHALQAGTFGLLRKPFNRPELLSALEAGFTATLPSPTAGPDVPVARNDHRDRPTWKLSGGEDTGR